MFEDNEDRAVELLEQIAGNTGGLGDQTTVNKDVDISGQTADGRTGLVPLRSYVCVETDNLDAANEDGTVTLEPGDTKPLCRIRETGDAALAVYAVGAVDANNVEYSLHVDNSITVGGRTNSPLGTLNTPFSFVQMLGGAIPASTSAEYRAHLSGDAGGPVDLAGRLHAEVMG